MEPATIAALLRELAVYYELEDDRHRAFAYDRAAKAVEAANGLHRLIEEGRLEELPGVGASIARVVAELGPDNAGLLGAMRARGEATCRKPREGCGSELGARHTTQVCELRADELRDLAVRGGAVRPSARGPAWYAHRNAPEHARTLDRHGDPQLRPGLDPGEDLLDRRALA